MSPVVLIVEDNANNARLAAKLLNRANFTTHIAEDGESGYEMALSHNPDLLLVDLGLPDVDGQTIIALLRQQPSMENVPIVAFTAWPQDTAHEMAKAYGCDGVITKPIDTRSFVEQIQSYLNNSPTESAP